MSQLPRQTTLATSCTIGGRGFWTGKQNTLTIVPAEANAGIQFVRTDLPGHPRVPALSEFSKGISMRTQLGHGFADFEMVEHVMSALYGLGITNCEVHCTAAEMPGFDGSSHRLSLALSSAGQVELTEPRTTFVADSTIEICDEDKLIRLEPPTEPDSNALFVEYQLDYGANSPIGQSTFATQVTPEIYAQEIAPARTFISAADAAKLQLAGIATHVSERDLLVFDEQGPVNNELRFPDECARHKALDVLGDLALAGVHLIGRITAIRSGHQLNGQLASAIQDRVKQRQFQTHRAA
ncbi:MAG: UDP-3-O-acyl-N-acetylglucosamine deacetylase [Pirellulaceae bacterium]